ncbi:putative amidophosphoribosyltransferase [Bradyrhizobium sp. S3.14.4]
MPHLRACARCGAGVSSTRRYCAPCADERRIEAKQKQNRKRKHLVQDAPAVRYVGTKRGMLRRCVDDELAAGRVL